MSRETHVWMCVQLRLVCSAGVSPARVRIRGPIAWMAGIRETDYLKPIDKASVSETVLIFSRERNKPSIHPILLDLKTVSEIEGNS